MNTKSFQYQLTVPASAIDDMGHVNNVVYVEWVQEVARQAWNKAVKDLQKSEPEMAAGLGINNLAWVALNHYIEYKSPAFEDDEIVVFTFVKSFTGARSERHTRIYRLSDDKTLATAVTHWCLLKMPEAKPLRVPQELKNIFIE